MPETMGLRILLAVTGSAHSEAAARLVANIPWPADTSVHVLTVAPERWPYLGSSPEAEHGLAEVLAGMRQADYTAAEAVAGAVAALLSGHELAVQTDVGEGRPSEVILQCAGELRSDLIVIGAKGLNAPAEFRLGSTAHKVAHYAPCPVLVARPAEREWPLSVVLATDGSSEAQGAAAFLCVLSLPRWAEVTVASVGEAPFDFPVGERHLIRDLPAPLQQALSDAAETHATAAMARLQTCGAQVRCDIRVGHAATEILAAAWEHDADLIVIGARGQTRAEPFPLGSVAQKIVKYAECLVLLVR